MSHLPSVVLAALTVLFHVAAVGAASPGPSGQSAASPRQAPPRLQVPPPLEVAPPSRVTPPLRMPPLPSPPLAPRPQPAPPAQEQGEPHPGQPGKDVIWLPTPESLVERMLAMAQVGPGDVVYDLGSGDGRMVIAAARRGAQAVGVEFDPGLVALSERRAQAEGVRGRARFLRGDIFETDFKDATAVTLYLLPSLNLRLRPTLLAMRPGTRVVSHAFGMDDWAPDEVSRAEGRTAYLWIVPAAVEGAWRVELEGGTSFDVTLVRRFQEVEGTIALGVVEAALREPVLRGNTIRFGFVDAAGAWYELTGTLSGSRMSGAYQTADRKAGWTAVRR